MTVVVVVEDDPDIQSLIKTIFSMDSRFSLSHVVDTAEKALEVTKSDEPEIIVLDHGLAGKITGLDVARSLKELAPNAKIIMFTSRAELRAPSDDDAAVDAFLLKTETGKLLPLAQLLTQMMTLI